MRFARYQGCRPVIEGLVSVPNVWDWVSIRDEGGDMFTTTLTRTEMRCVCQSNAIGMDGARCLVDQAEMNL